MPAITFVSKAKGNQAVTKSGMKNGAFATLPFWQAAFQNGRVKR